MRRELTNYLACPSCSSDLSIEVAAEDEGEIIDGTLTCSGCGDRYAIANGVPRMNRAMRGLERVQKSFSFEWKAHHQGTFEEGTLFGLTKKEDWAYFVEATGFDDVRLQAITVLDGGCGSGKLTRQIAEHGAGCVIGVDINDAVDEAQAFCRDLPNVHIVQGNIFALPLKRNLFDLEWSHGVIHHTPDAKGAHRSLASHLKPGGTLYVWVYADRFNPFRLTKDILSFLRITRLPASTLLRLSNVFAVVSLGILTVYRGARRIPGLHPRTPWGLRTVRPRRLDELKMTWFDAISPEFDSRHTVPEVIEWFEQLGFEQIHAIEEPKVGVRGVSPSPQADAGLDEEDRQTSLVGA